MATPGRSSGPEASCRAGTAELDTLRHGTALDVRFGNEGRTSSVLHDHQDDLPVFSALRHASLPSDNSLAGHASAISRRPEEACHRLHQKPGRVHSGLMLLW